MTYIKSRKVRLFFILCLVALASVWFVGCSMYDSLGRSAEYLVQDLTRPDRGLKRKIVLAPFGNPWKIQEVNLQASVLAPLGAQLAEGCPNVLMMDSLETKQMVLRHLVSPTGLDDNLLVMESARKTGAMALVTGILWMESTETEKKGIVGFRKQQEVFKASMDVWVYDTLTGAKLLDETVEHELVYQQGTTWEKGTEWPPQVLEKMVDKAGDAICRALKNTPWKGFITAQDGQTVTLSAGTDVDLEPGDLLLVYGPGTNVTGVDEQSFRIPGPRLGMVRVTDCSEDTSRTQIMEGMDFPPGSWVIPE